jgi:uncharacterized protein
LYYQYPFNQWPQRNMNHNVSTRSEIKVVGEGSISIQPDMAQIVLGVETEYKELLKAQSENAQKISNIIQALRNLGILEENIQTDNFTIYPMYDFMDGKQVFRGYRVEHLLRVTIPDINSAGLVVDTGVENGANRVSNITFQVSNSAALYQKALERAVADAIKKAETIAAELGIELNPVPKSIMEERRLVEGPIPFHEAQMVKSASTEIQPGREEIKGTVTATFSTR